MTAIPEPDDTWIPTRMPVGQYRVTLTITGDDPGPNALAWLIEKTVAVHGHIVFVERMEHLRSIT